MARPLVSAVIPAYNAEATVRRAIDSVLAQPVERAEIIVCDDGSTDGTPAILREYGDRLIVVTQPNRGRGAARNACLARAAGEFVALLDADDWWKPSRLARQLAAAAERPEAGLVYANAHILHGGRIYRTMNGQWHVGHSGYVFPWLLRNNFVPTSTVLARRSVIERAGAFDETLPRSQDLEWLLRMAAETTFLYLDEVLACYDDRTWSTPDKGLDTYVGFRGALERIARRYPELASRYAREFRKSLSDCESEIGRHYEDRGDFAAAAAAYARGLAATPTSGALRVRVARCASRATDTDGYAQAVAAWVRVLGRDPYDVDAHFQVGTLALRMGDLALAESQLTAALSDGYLYQKFPECLNNLAVLEARRGERDRAGELLQQACAQQAFYSDALLNLEALGAGADPSTLRITSLRVFA